MNSCSKKRCLCDCESSPSKKQRIRNESSITNDENVHLIEKNKSFDVSSTSTTIKSKNFPIRSDHIQFQQIFEAIDASTITQNYNIPQSINQQIAEFATGILRKCANKTCDNDISLLYQYHDTLKISYCHKKEYKYHKHHIYGDQFFCSQCMDIIKHCDCTLCKNEYCDKYKQCNQCKYIQYQCDNGCFCGVPLFQRNMKQCMVTDCNSCICSNCDDNKWIVPPNGNWNNQNYGICDKCYDQTIIDCNRCNVKCKLYYKSNKLLTSIDGGNEYVMMRCDEDGCKAFVCINCNKKDRNGLTINCKDCGVVHSVYCSQHRTSTNPIITDQPSCCILM